VVLRHAGVAAAAVLQHHRYGHDNVEWCKINRAVCHTFVPIT
jgi:hypothetical protein